MKRSRSEPLRRKVDPHIELIRAGYSPREVIDAAAIGGQISRQRLNEAVYRVERLTCGPVKRSPTNAQRKLSLKKRHHRTAMMKRMNERQRHSYLKRFAA